MSLIAIMVLAFSMSADAFAAALGKGTELDHPRLSEAVRTGLVFGTIEAITPLIGWVGGLAASAYITAIDHWIAFGLLFAIGAKMIWDSVRRAETAEKPKRHSYFVLVITAIGTSIDAMVVGITLAFLDVNIIGVALAIDAATFMMTTLGVMIGRVAGKTLGRTAEALGGIGLIVIGTAILIEHTMLA